MTSAASLDARLVRGQRLLQRRGTARRIDHAGELGEKPVARGLEHPPAMARQRRIDHRLAQGPQPRQRPLLVGLHQLRVPRHVPRQDRRKPTLDHQDHPVQYGKTSGS
jgi:hypothetical protein